MRVIKRNGAEVEFDIVKIIAAVTKANDVVDEEARMTPVQIQRIAESVEFSCQSLGRAPTVEEIQDFVEHQIMAHGAFEVAKRYITYRYNRSLVRKSNTTDDKILSLIECNNEEAKQENSNKNPVVNSTLLALVTAAMILMMSNSTSAPLRLMTFISTLSFSLLKVVISYPTQYLVVYFCSATQLWHIKAVNARKKYVQIPESVEIACQGLGRAPTVEEIQDFVEHQIMANEWGRSMRVPVMTVPFCSMSSRFTRSQLCMCWA